MSLKPRAAEVAEASEAPPRAKYRAVWLGLVQPICNPRTICKMLETEWEAREVGAPGLKILPGAAPDVWKNYIAPLRGANG
jgi:hypothetical protein